MGNDDIDLHLTFLEKKLDLLASIQDYVELYNVQLDQEDDNEALDLRYNNDDTLTIGTSAVEQEADDRRFLAHEVLAFLRLSANDIGANTNAEQQSSFDMHLDDIETAALGGYSSNINDMQSFAIRDNERATGNEEEDFIVYPTKQYRFLQHVLSEEEFIEMDDLAADARANAIVNKVKTTFQQDKDGHRRNNSHSHYEKLRAQSDGTPVYHYIPSDKHKEEEQKTYSDVKLTLKLVESELDKYRSYKVKSAKDKASRMKALQTPRRLFDHTSFTMFNDPSFNHGNAIRRLEVAIEDCEAEDGICVTGVTAINIAVAGIDIILNEIETVQDIVSRASLTYDLFNAMHLAVSALEL